MQRLLLSLHETEADEPVLYRICLVGVDCTAVAGAGVSKLVDGQHQIVAATDERAAAVENLQLTLTEGPCVDVMKTSRPVREPDLTSPRAVRRWPNFARNAVAEEVLAVFAFPLLVGGVAVGALDVYSVDRRDLLPEQVKDVQLLADLAALAVKRGPSPCIDGVAVGAEAIEPWAHPAVVHNASGMISAQLDVSVEEALLRLRAFAFVSGRAVADLARDVVDRRLRIDSWSANE